MCNIALELNDQLAADAIRYAKDAGMSLEEYITHLINESLEDKYDAECADKAYQEYLEDPETFTLEEVANKYGFKN